MGALCSSANLLDPLQLMTLELETGFTKSSIRRLESRFLSLDKDHKGYLERRDLMVIPEVANNPIGERLVNSFFPTKYHSNGLIDQEDSEKLYFFDFAKNFAAFRQVSEKHPDKNVSNSKDHKLFFLYKLLDQKQCGYFTRIELYDMLEMMLGANVSLDQVVYIADRLLSEADADGDGVISFEEFKNSVGDLDIENKMAFVGFK